MNNIVKNITKLCLSSILALICLLSSCTYDYFEDESNYVIYVPKADVNKRTDTYKVNDVGLYIYNNETLERERHSVSPFEENARSRVGNFNFKLFPGQHYAYCFSNTSSVNFLETESFMTSRFVLQQTDNGTFKEPLAILLDKKEPLIQFPGPVVTDTAWYEHKYVGRICVAFKNMTNLDSRLTFDNIKNVKILAEGVGTEQYLYQITDSVNTRSSRLTSDDKLNLTAQLYKNPYTGFDFGFENYYFPSLSETFKDFIRLGISFIDGNNNILYTINADVVDNNYDPMILHMNESLLVKVDGKNVQVLRMGDLIQWEPDIHEGENNTPGGGGMEM